MLRPAKGRRKMPFSKIAHPEHLAILTSVLDDYCLARDVRDHEERDHIARRLLALFETVTADPAELRLALEKSFTAPNSDGQPIP